MFHWRGLQRPATHFASRAAERSSRVVQPHGGMRSGLAVAGIVAAAIAAGGTGYLRYAQLLADEHQAAVQSETANAQLQAELARLRDKLGAANRDLADTQRRLTAASEEAQAKLRQRSEAEHRLAANEESKGDKIAQLNRAIEQIQRELKVTESQRVTLMARLSKSEADLAAMAADRAQVQAVVEQWKARLQQLETERNKAMGERDELRGKVSRLEQKLSMAHTPPVPAEKPTAAAAPPAAVPPVATAPAPAGVPQPAVAAAAVAVPTVAPAPQHATVVVPRGTHSGIGEIERVLASAGVDVRHLFSQFGVTRGEGGPFIPAPNGRAPAETLTPEKLAALRAMVKTLPLSAPLTGYEVGSGFGVRRDPINGRSSFHTGLDFDAPYMSPVYATAAGIVTYAGYRDDYGKIVEIDHGNGISTRYAHLHRYTVSVGQRVAAHSQIGFLGSSGRATGPHVHYEVLVNGEPQDPSKFLHLSHVVPAAVQR